MEEYGTVKSIKNRSTNRQKKKQTIVCFSKERETQIAKTLTKWYEGWNAEVYRNMYNKNGRVKILSICEDKQEQDTKTKRKLKENLEKELEK